MMKKEVQKALAKAHEIEKIPVPTRKEIVAIYKEGMEEAEKLRKLLKPEWFIKDTDAKRASSPSRKKKTL